MNSENYLTINIVENHYSKSTKKIKIVMILSLLLLIICAPILNHYYDYTLKYQIPIITLMLIFIISAIMYNLSDKSKKTGSIKLNKNEIELISKENNIKIKLSEIASIEFHYEGYEGETNAYYRAMLAREGNNNKITFIHNNDSYVFQVMLSNVTQRTLLKRILKHYDNIGIKIKTNLLIE